MKPELERFIPVANAIASTFYGISEVVLHDLSFPEKSIVYINGELTGRKVGAPSTTLVLSIFKAEGDNAKDMSSYITKAPDGRALKSSTIFIRNEAGKIIGCMCINIDITSIMTMSKFLNSLSKTTLPHEETTEINEHFADDISEITEVLIQEAIKGVGKPIELMDKEEKTKIVSTLEKKGLFLVKGSITRVAKALHVSKYTVYNYLEDIRINHNDDEK